MKVSNYTAASIAVAASLLVLFVTLSTSARSGDVAEPKETERATINLASSLTTKSGASLSWTTVPGAHSFNIYRGDDIIANTPAQGPIPNKPQFTNYFDTGLAPSSTYSYKVAAVNSTGHEVKWSNQISVETKGNALETPLRTIIFSPQINDASDPTNNETLAVLKKYFTSGDGVISSSDYQMKEINDAIGKNILSNHYLAPRIAPYGAAEDCELGYVNSVDQFISDAKKNTAEGYRYQYIVSDIEGWCWTPSSERDNDAYITSFDTVAGKAHAAGFEAGIQPTHDELVEGINDSSPWYPKIHYDNLDFFLIQFQKYYFTEDSGYRQIDETAMSQIQSMITLARQQNPKIVIFLQFNFDWGANDKMLQVVDRFKDQIDGVSMIHLGPDDPDVIAYNPPFQGYGTPSHIEQFLAAVKSM
jgi:hypothetical protein